ncbi:MAG: HepT-like ribonuclease domain-containing protein [Candidatus Asgardarchaeum sp.]
MKCVDKDYIENMLKDIIEALSELKFLTSLDIDEFIKNRSARFSMRYSIVVIVEGSADIGIYVLERCFNEEIKGYRDIFMRLSERGVIDSETAMKMASLSSLRNMIVHRYWNVDDIRIYSEAKKNGIRAIEKFIEEVKEFASKSN